MTEEAGGSTYCRLYYWSNKAADGHISFDFWFAGSLIRLIGDRSFSRGDYAELIDVDSSPPSETRVHLRILDKAAKFEKELPTLLLFCSKIYVGGDRRYNIVTKNNVEILRYLSSTTKEHNKLYAVIALVTGRRANICCVDEQSGDSFEWDVSDDSQ
jgi:hypothetical protein